MSDSIGATLRAAREMRHLTLAQVSESTRVRTHYLQALESDDLSAMPSAAQARGFLRIYAHFLGLDLSALVPPPAPPAPASPLPAQAPTVPTPEESKPDRPNWLRWLLGRVESGGEGEGKGIGESVADTSVAVDAQAPATPPAAAGAVAELPTKKKDRR
jgi:transcriptional regulator with XRE-family HTH domain